MGRRAFKCNMKVKLPHLLILYGVTPILRLSNSRVLTPLFSKDFLGDYQALQSKLTPEIMSMNNNLLLRTMMLEDVDWERQDNVEKEMKVKL